MQYELQSLRRLRADSSQSSYGNLGVGAMSAGHDPELRRKLLELSDTFEKATLS